MSDEELNIVKLQKITKGKRKGSYTLEANMAYVEIQRRKGISPTIGLHNPIASKYSADIDYYGNANVDNR